MCFNLVNSTGNHRQLALQALDVEMPGFACDCASAQGSKLLVVENSEAKLTDLLPVD